MALTQLTASDQPRENLNEFGDLLFSLMAARGVRSASELKKVLKDSGFDVSRQTITNYATGYTPVGTPFVDATAKALRLNKGERRRLAWAACYGA